MDDPLSTQNTKVRIELTWDQLAATTLALDVLKMWGPRNGDEFAHIKAGVDSQKFWDDIYRRAYKILQPDPKDVEIEVIRNAAS